MNIFNKKLIRTVFMIFLIMTISLFFAPSMKSFAEDNKSVYEISDMGMDIKVILTKNSNGEIISAKGTATTDGLYVNTALVSTAVTDIGKDFDLTITMDALTVTSDTFTVSVNTADMLSGKPMRVYDITNATKTAEYIMLNKDFYTGAAGQTLRLNLDKNRAYKLVLATDATEIDKKIVDTVKPAQKSHYIAIGKTYAITLSKDSNASSVKSITYTSSDNYTAVIDAGGVVKGVTEGKVDITGEVTFNNGDTTSIHTTIHVTKNEKEAIEGNKKPNPLKIKTKTYTIKVPAKNERTTKKATITSSKVKSAISGAEGKLTFKKMSGSQKIVINKNGQITVKKGAIATKAGEVYTLKVKVNAAGNATYRVGTKTMTIKIKVKSK